MKLLIEELIRRTLIGDLNWYYKGTNLVTIITVRHYEERTDSENALNLLITDYTLTIANQDETEQSLGRLALFIHTKTSGKKILAKSESAEGLLRELKEAILLYMDVELYRTEQPLFAHLLKRESK